jgi:rhamnose transport system permease protein
MTKALAGVRALKRHRREISVAVAILALAGVLAIATPGYFARENLSDLFLANLPVLIVALGSSSPGASTFPWAR